LRYVISLAAAVFLVPACFGSDADLTDSGEGKPVISVEFPQAVEAETSATATFQVENPGPGDMDSVLITFARLGRADLPDPLVDVGVQGENDAVIEVEPEPVAVSDDAVVYRFGGLEEGESMTVGFTLRMPSEPGAYANSVTAADGSDLERARGVRLETEVER
jgi:hypothetical protein